MTPAKKLMRHGKKRPRPDKAAQREECRAIAEALRAGGGDIDIDAINTALLRAGRAPDSAPLTPSD